MKKTFSKMLDAIPAEDRVKLRIWLIVTTLAVLLLTARLGVSWERGFGSHPVVFEREAQSFTISYGETFAVVNTLRPVLDVTTHILRPGEFVSVEGVVDMLTLRVFEETGCPSGLKVVVWVERNSISSQEFCADFNSAVVITPSFNTHWDGETFNGARDGKLVHQYLISPALPTPTATVAETAVTVTPTP